ncbi:MAG TPA: hypothetical protein VKN36_01940 [Eudoraea sp.]|nr:hypothetical protein [Eudoraea sp.]
MKKPFYSNAYLYLALGFIATLIGFFPTYFNKLGETDSLHHFHGITGTLWMIILIAQPMFYRFGKMKYHRMIGWASIALAPIVFFGAIRMIQFMMQSREPSELLYQFAFLDVFTILPFALFVILGVVYRKDIQYHSRFMICTIFGPLSAGIVRIFYMVLNNWNSAITGTYVLFELILLVLIFDDKKKGRIKSPYVIAFTIFLIQHVLIYYVGDWGWWRELTHQLAELNLGN